MTSSFICGFKCSRVMEKGVMSEEVKAGKE